MVHCRSMEKKRKSLLTLFLTTLEISAFTFGGGYVIIPLMRRTFVGKLGWIDEGEMLDLTAIAQSAPGPIAVNAAILIGYRTGGIAGAAVSALGAVLPPLVIISIISAFYQAFRSNRYVSLAMTAMSAGVAAVVVDVVIAMAWDILKRKKLLSAVMMAVVFVLVGFLDVSVIAMMIAAAGAGYLSYIHGKRRGI